MQFDRFVDGVHAEPIDVSFDRASDEDETVAVRIGLDDPKKPSPGREHRPDPLDIRKQRLTLNLDPCPVRNEEMDVVHKNYEYEFSEYTNTRGSMYLGESFDATQGACQKRFRDAFEVTPAASGSEPHSQLALLRFIRLVERKIFLRTDGFVHEFGNS